MKDDDDGKFYSTLELNNLIVTLYSMKLMKYKNPHSFIGEQHIKNLKSSVNKYVKNGSRKNKVKIAKSVSDFFLFLENNRISDLQIKESLMYLNIFLIRFGNQGGINHALKKTDMINAELRTILLGMVTAKSNNGEDSYVYKKYEKKIKEKNMILDCREDRLILKDKDTSKYIIVFN